MNLVGRKTYAVVIVIVALALVKKYLAVDVPNELFIALFALAFAAMRSAVSGRGAGVSTAVLLFAGLSLLCGCAVGRIRRGDIVVTRAALLYPAEFGYARVSTSNEVWEIGGYKSDGGAGGAAAITAAAVEAGVKSAIK